MNYFVIMKQNGLGSSYVYGPMTYEDAQSELLKRRAMYDGYKEYQIELVRIHSPLDEGERNRRVEELREESRNECGCDLCQCFGQGNCLEHDEQCDHCNSGLDASDCEWLRDI